METSNEYAELVYQYVQWIKKKANSLTSSDHSPPTTTTTTSSTLLDNSESNEETQHEEYKQKDEQEQEGSNRNSQQSNEKNESTAPIEYNNRLAQDIEDLYTEFRPKLIQQLYDVKTKREKMEIVTRSKFMITHYFKKRMYELQNSPGSLLENISSHKILQMELELDEQTFGSAYPSVFESMYDKENNHWNHSQENEEGEEGSHHEKLELLTASYENEFQDMWYDGFAPKKKTDWKALMKREAKTYFPPITWVPEYLSWSRLKSDLKNDIVAGLTVGVMLIPQGMAYAIVAGLDPIYGLYSSFLPLIVYALFGTSRQLGVGPVAILSLLTNSALQTLGVPEEEYPAWAFLLAFISGCITTAFGLFRLGFVVNFLGHPVISGFTSAASIIIGFSQMKHVLGVSPKSEDYFVMDVYQMFAEVPNIHWPTLLMGTGFIAILLFLKYFQMPIKFRGRRRTLHFRKVPSAIIAVFMGTLISYFMYLGEGWDNDKKDSVGGVKLLGEIPPGLPAPVWPFSGINLTWTAFGELIVLSIPICLLGFIESYSVGKFFATKNDYEISANQELLGLGLASVVGSFFQSYPVTGGLSRTAVNANSGSKSPLSSVISALVIMLALLVLTPVFQFLPKNLLGAIIITAVVKLFDIDEMKFTWKTNKGDFAILIVSFLCTLLIGVEIGVGVAIGISLFLVIFLSSRPRIALLGRLPGTELYRNARRNVWKEAGIKRTKGIVILRPDYNIYFANAEYLEKTIMSNIKEVQEEDPVYGLVLDFSGVGDVDSSGLHSLAEINKTLKKMDITIYIANYKIPVYRRMKQAGLLQDDAIAEDHLFESLHQAVKEAQADVLRRSSLEVKTEMSSSNNEEKSPQQNQSEDKTLNNDKSDANSPSEETSIEMADTKKDENSSTQV